VLRPYKFLIVSVVQQVDEEGTVLAEASTEEPDVCFGIRGLINYAENFDQILAAREAQMNGGMSNGKGEEGDGLQGGAVADRQAAGDQQGSRRGDPRRRRTQGVPGG